MKKATTTALLLLIFSAASGAAQNTKLRSGWWFGAGVGSGSTSLDCGTCSTENVGGISGYLRFGRTIIPEILLGLEGIGWTHSDRSVSERVAYGSLTALVYPLKTGGYFFKGGIGTMKYTIYDRSDKLEAKSIGFNVGFGYDVRIAGDLSITPHVSWVTGKSKDASVNGVKASGPGITLSLLEFAIGISWH